MLKSICISLTLLALFQSFEIRAQNEQLFVEYDFYFYHHTGVYTIESISDAKANLQTVIRNYKLQSSPGVVENITEKKYIFKDRIKQIMTYEEQYPYYIVHENLDLMEWELTGKNVKILGYHCSQAKSFFRGRDYLAYFTTDLPYKVAPWKFNGLPGVVLKIFTDDGQLKITAKSLKIGSELKKIHNPFREKESISLEHFTEIYNLDQKKYLKSIRARDARNGEKSIWSSGRIDLITETDILIEKVFQTEMNKVKQ